MRELILTDCHQHAAEEEFSNATKSHVHCKGLSWPQQGLVESAQEKAELARTLPRGLQGLNTLQV